MEGLDMKSDIQLTVNKVVFWWFIVASLWTIGTVAILIYQAWN